MLIEAETPADIANRTELSHDEAETAFRSLLEHAEDDSSMLSLIIVVEEWALGYPPDDPIADSTVILASKVEDYSEKAYKIYGGFNVDLDSGEIYMVEKLEDTEDSYLPKSSVDTIFQL